ncbi:MAG: LON peptidase substrate-binding domain-containing protein, partial [Clostridia bacterium]|nr:LON peptidase substrate-binding domain-containing protein [Clostridia bacterium]
MTKKKNRIPLLPLRGLTVFPGTVIHFDVGRIKSKMAVDTAMKNDRLIFLVYQHDISVEEPKKADLAKMGTVAEVKQTLILPDGNMRILVEGISRASLTRYYDEEKTPMVSYNEKEEILCTDKLYEKGLMKRVENLLEDYLDVYDKVTPETIASLEDIDDAGTLADVTASNFPIKPHQKQEILEELDVAKRLEKLIAMMQEEVQVLEIERGVAKKLGRAIDKNQREYVIREQMKVLQSELEDIEPLSNDADKYRAEIEKRNLPKEVSEKLNEEIERLSRQPGMTQEYSVIQNYIETVLALPWDRKTEENLDINKARNILDRDHYGLKKVKERILEFLAVKRLGGEGNGSIICLIGPPGTGKTSIAKSLAEAMGREYVRISLGGIQNEAEIRGHRKTYIGSMPGRIMNAVKTAGVSNPLILFDEIDKMARDYKGDPASAMLEVLDKEQNKNFRDHFIELPFDLSETVFITTANSYEGIPY